MPNFERFNTKIKKEIQSLFGRQKARKRAASKKAQTGTISIPRFQEVLSNHENSVEIPLDELGQPIFHVTSKGRHCKLNPKLHDFV